MGLPLTGQVGRHDAKWRRYLIRHTAYHTLDHAWEMEDKDLLPNECDAERNISIDIVYHCRFCLYEAFAIALDEKALSPAARLLFMQLVRS